MNLLVLKRSSWAVVFSLWFSASMAWAGPSSQPLLKVTRSDNPSFLNQISLNLNEDGDLVTLGVSLEKNPITPDQLRQGYVLGRSGKIEVVRLIAGKGFDLKTGGPLTLRYLKQFKMIGANEYGDFPMDLVKEGGRWILRDEHHQEFNQLRMVAHSRGISQIVPINAQAGAQLQSWLDETLLPRTAAREEAMELSASLTRSKPAFVIAPGFTASPPAAPSDGALTAF